MKKLTINTILGSHFGGKMKAFLIWAFAQFLFVNQTFAVPENFSGAFSGTDKGLVTQIAQIKVLTGHLTVYGQSRMK